LDQERRADPDLGRATDLTEVDLSLSAHLAVPHVSHRHVRGEASLHGARAEADGRGGPGERPPGAPARSAGVEAAEDLPAEGKATERYSIHLAAPRNSPRTAALPAGSFCPPA